MGETSNYQLIRHSAFLKATVRNLTPTRSLSRYPPLRIGYIHILQYDTDGFVKQ